MPRFAVLEHDHPELHWDLLLEAGPALRTWRLAQPPQTARTVAATQLPEHRLLYLDYEGPVSGGRGVVRAWDRGVFEPELPAEGGARLALRLCGQRLNAGALLVHQQGTAWTLEIVGDDAPLSAPPGPRNPGEEGN